MGISFDRRKWPHGKGGRAIVHGALFGQDSQFQNESIYEIRQLHKTRSAAF